jgi:hypothetical protein
MPASAALAATKVLANQQSTASLGLQLKTPTSLRQKIIYPCGAHLSIGCGNQQTLSFALPKTPSSS